MSDRLQQPVTHISVCICTYRRPDLLDRLLNALADQVSDGTFAHSLVVVDNDSERSAEPLVSRFADKVPFDVTYCVEPRQNIALARNKALQNAAGDLVAFIDDDEFPIREWLLTLLTALRNYRVDGVLGPVLPYFDQEPPAWIKIGRFYERATHPTGTVITWRQGRTGNLLFRKAIVDSVGEPFRPQFLTGEDQDFFRRMIAKGHVFVWCDEAVAYEAVPAARWNRRFMLKRALFRGSVSVLHPTCGPRVIAKSFAAVPIYLVCLPFAVAMGQATFMNCLIRLCDHVGRVLALFGVRVVRDPYVVG